MRVPKYSWREHKVRYFIFLTLLVVIILSPSLVDAQSSLKCPDGTYYGKDNQGNDACRDIETNKVVKVIPTTQTNQKSEMLERKQTDPCQNPFAPGCIALPSTNFSNNSILLVGIIAIVVVIILVIVASKKKKSTSEMKPIDYTEYTSTPSSYSNNDRMMWTCSSCRQKFTDRQSYISHGCHFR